MGQAGSEPVTCVSGLRSEFLDHWWYCTDELFGHPLYIYKKFGSSVGLGVFRRGFFEDGAYRSLWLAAPSYCAAVQATPPANSGGSSSCLTVLPATLLPEPTHMLRPWLISYRTLALDAYTGGCRQLTG